MTPIAMLSGCLCLMPFSVANEIDVHLIQLSDLQLYLLIYLGIFAGGLPFFLLNWVLNQSTATFTTIFVTMNPITATVLGYLLLDEGIKINFIIGVFIVFSGLALAVKSQAKGSQPYID